VDRTLSFLLETHPVNAEPRLEMVVQMPTDRATLARLMRDDPEFDSLTTAG
jgi:hypothetical protein